MHTGFFSSLQLADGTTYPVRFLGRSVRETAPGEFTQTWSFELQPGCSPTPAPPAEISAADLAEQLLASVGPLPQAKFNAEGALRGTQP